MTVQTTSILISGTESSAKLLNNNVNTKDSSDELSFSATMNEMASNYNFDNQHYMLPDGQVLMAMKEPVSNYNFDGEHYILPDGQVLTAEQLLEMQQNGKTLPGVNLPPLSELQQYKFQADLNDPKFQPEIRNIQFDSKIVQFDPVKYRVNNNFDFKQLPHISQQFDQNLNQLFKMNTTNPEKLIASNIINQTSNVTSDITPNGFSAVSSYQLVNGASATTGIMSNSFSIATPVQHPHWNQSLGQSVQWMVNQNIQQADIKLNPPELGMLDIRITVNNDQASVTFTAPNSAVREALEVAMPRLREMLEESGISLADANVSEHSLQQEQTDQNFDLNEDEVKAGSENHSSINSDEANNNASNKMQLGLLDTYA